ncbi:MAG: rane protein, partial [Cryobacterium sp.]|nr:rane protein [Cryobacterium sp.]
MLMTRIMTALLAALEALIVVAIGVGIALVPLTILWATQFGLATDWLIFWRAAVDV